jgi:isopenicillin N synthase-like dioxygenase
MRHINRLAVQCFCDYPPITEPLLPGQLRSGAYTDFGTMTLFFHYGAEGLEIQRPNGTWFHAPSILVRLLLEAPLHRWTNGQLGPAHRVVPPQGNAAQRSRYSTTLFYEPRHEVVISCLKPCQGPTRSALFRRLLRVNILKRSGRKILAVGMKIKELGDAVQRVVLLNSFAWEQCVGFLE